MDWVAFITTSTVAELMAHLKYFRVAHRLAEQDAAARLKKVYNCQCYSSNQC